MDRRGRVSGCGPPCTRIDLSERLANHFRREQQVIVVDNDEIAGTVQLGDFLRKQRVGL